MTNSDTNMRNQFDLEHTGVACTLLLSSLMSNGFVDDAELENAGTGCKLDIKSLLIKSHSYYRTCST